MGHTIPAVFSDGVFRRLAPVGLAEGTQVQLHVQSPINDLTRPSELTPEELARQRTAIEEMLAEIERLPIEEPDDGFSGRDHDKILYGRP
jgi:predicted DNA-binding antitoxin AbrB/MazE fold protein